MLPHCIDHVLFFYYRREISFYKSSTSLLVPVTVLPPWLPEPPVPPPLAVFLYFS